MRSVIAFLFLSAQAVWIGHEQLGDTRYFCWAPNDYMVSYRLRVALPRGALSPSEIEQRYRMPASGVYQTIATHLIDNLRQYESTYGRNDHATVLLTFSTNGHQAHEWTWPE